MRGDDGDAEPSQATPQGKVSNIRKRAREELLQGNHLAYKHLCRAASDSAGDLSKAVIVNPAGVMCHKHWRDKQLNPSGIRVVSREFLHEPVAMYKDLRCACICPAPTLD